MKSLLFTLTVAVFWLSCSSFKPEFKKVKEAEVDQKQVQFAQKFASDFLTTVKDGKTYQFNGEAIAIIEQSLNAESQRVVYKQLQSQFGDYVSIAYAETWKEDTQNLVIVRFKSDFTESKTKLEIRVVLDKDNKIAGFFTKPWSDML